MKYLLTILSFAVVCYGEVEEAVVVNALSVAPIEVAEVSETPVVLPRKSAALAGGLSFIPGVGHFYLGDYRTGGTLFGVASGSQAADRFASDNFGYSGLSLVSDTIFYSVYAGYRDGRAFNRYEGYSYEMPRDSFVDLATAPFRPSILKKKEVWGGIIGALIIAGMVTHYGYIDDDLALLDTNLRRGKTRPLVAFPTGLCEEAFFRGYLQSQLAEVTNRELGIALSSLTFGAAHIGNARYLPKSYQRKYYRYSIPLITAIGAYFAWLTDKNHSLQESVAVHTWYDFVLFTLGVFTTRACVQEERTFSVTIPF